MQLSRPFKMNKYEQYSSNGEPVIRRQAYKNGPFSKNSANGNYLRQEMVDARRNMMRNPQTGKRSRNR